MKIELTEKQKYWLLRLLNREWDEEVNYQYSNTGIDTDYLKELFDVYKAILGKPKNFIEATDIEDDINQKREDINNLEGEL